jgi:hypothetical protein
MAFNVLPSFRICAAACLISHLIRPLDLVTIAMYYSLSKRTLFPLFILGGTRLKPLHLIVYFNSLLGMLNAREALRENIMMDGGISEIATNVSELRVS